MALHPMQIKILKYLNEYGVRKQSLRSMAKYLGIEGMPSLIKHHLTQLEIKGMIIGGTRHGFKVVTRGRSGIFYNLPIVSFPMYPDIKSS